MNEYEPGAMYASALLLKQKKLDPAQMDEGQIVAAIRQLATDVHTHASPDYYTQRLGALRILAEALTARK